MRILRKTVGKVNVKIVNVGKSRSILKKFAGETVKIEEDGVKWPYERFL